MSMSQLIYYLNPGLNQALNMAIPGGPKFEPLFRDMHDMDDDWYGFIDCTIG